MNARDIVALRAADVRNARDFGTPADIAQARSAYARARAAMLREWDRLDERSTRPAPKGNGRA